MSTMARSTIVLLVSISALILSFSAVSAHRIEQNEGFCGDNSGGIALNPIGLISCPERAADPEEQVNITLLLYSPQKKRDFVVHLDNQDINGKLLQNGFNPKLPTMLLIHAFQQHGRIDWLKDARGRCDLMFDDSNGEQRFNLMILDWSTYSMKKYKIAASYVANMGKSLGTFLENLAKGLHYDMTKMHITAYSLGSHIAGMTGKYLKGKNLKLGRITSLDAAGPCFFDSSDFAEKNVLRSSDANLVVVKHYDRLAFGPRRPIGGVDIYVNGGRIQPGKWIPGNSHTRASEHEVQPFSDDCYEVAYACRSRGAFLAGECGDCGQSGEKCYYNDGLDEFRLRKQLGPLPSYEPNTTMFIETGSNPLCRHHYQVIVQMKANCAKNWLDFIATGSVTLRFNPLLHIEPMNYVENDRFTALLLVDKRIYEADKFDAKVRSIRKSTKEFLRQLDYIEIKFLSHPIAEERTKGSFKFCVKDVEKEQLGNCLDSN